MKVLGPLMIALVALGCNTPQDPAGTAAGADTTATAPTTATPTNAEPPTLVGHAGGGVEVAAMAGSYFVRAEESGKNVTVKMHIGEDGRGELYLAWTGGKPIEQIHGAVTLKEGVLTITNPKLSESFTVLTSGQLQYAGSRPELKGIVLNKGD